MIITKMVKVKYSKNHKYYENLGYVFENTKSVINIPIHHLSKGSHVKVEVKCDYCDDIMIKSYKTYIIQNIKHGIDSCRKCFFNKNILTLKEKYGIEHQMYIDGVKEKSKNTCLKKYGVEHYTQTDEYKEKCKNTCLEKYGVEYALQSDKIIRKMEQNNLEKYGVKNVFQSNEIKEKIKETNLEKYGVENVFQSEEIKEKIKTTLLERYGVEHPMLCEKIKEKVRQKFIESGYMRTYNRKLYIDYAKIVRLKSVDKRKKLLEKWDGYDYYDGEYIKNNLELEPTNLDYPEMDHKISIKYGFDNNISINDIIGDNNLCITKKRINSKKSYKTEDEFKNNF